MSSLFETDPLVTGYAQVAIERGIDVGSTGLTYGITEELAGIQVGDRVIVPLGKRDKLVPGYVVELQDDCDLRGVKSIQAREPRSVSLPDDLVKLARWIASYYCCPLGMVFQTMLPAAVKKGIGQVTELMVSVAPDEPDAPATGAKSTPLQRAVLEVARRRAEAEGNPWIEIHELAQQAKARTTLPVRNLIDRGLLIARRQSAIRASRGDLTLFHEPTKLEVELTPDQARAVTSLNSAIRTGFSVHLLHGVTGSGKTEVYLRVIEESLCPKSKIQSSESASTGLSSTSDREIRPPESAPQNPKAGVIVLVPEISLTPQTVRRFVSRFEDVAVLHSGLTAAQRHEQWQRIRRGQARIVIGARSAVFAPLANVGLIIVDEEHDTSYKQDQLPRYHARDVAIKRGQLLNAPVLLGSATPSLESYHNVTDRQTYSLHELPTRVPGLKLPHIEIVDMKHQLRKRYEYTGKVGASLLSLHLEGLLRQTVQEGGQALLLLNRRGFANYIACPDHGCGWIMNCEHCDVTVVYHKDKRLPTGGFVRCHHCNAEQLLPRACPQCDRRVTVFGLGTQRVEEQLQRVLPNARISRMDSDTMRTGRHYHETLEAFRGGEIDVLVGTQMIAKGLDFPNVWLVGVISADTSLHLPDFRASERTFQLVSQVAGRTGRGEHGGRVIVQTFNPHDAAIVLASQHNYVAFAQRELAVRKEVGLPPVTRMARIVVRDREYQTAVERAKNLSHPLIAAAARLGSGIQIRGPAPCPIARIAGYFRQQIELIGPNASQLQALLTELRNQRLVKSDHQIAVDVDPVALL